MKGENKVRVSLKLGSVTACSFRLPPPVRHVLFIDYQHFIGTLKNGQQLAGIEKHPAKLNADEVRLQDTSLVADIESVEYGRYAPETGTVERK